MTSWRLALGLFVWLGGLGIGRTLFAQSASTAKPQATADTSSPLAESERERRFRETLTGATLRGFFNLGLSAADQPPELKSERYEIHSVRKLPGGDLWLFDVRIVYGDRDLRVPLPLPVHWAGETPVINVESVSIPGLGTMNAHVVIDGNRYAGTWQHDALGGFLFGVIERSKGDAKPGD